MICPTREYLYVSPDDGRTGPTLIVLPEALSGLVDPGAVLHYDQSLEIREPLDPRGAELESRSEVLGLYQRRGGALLRTKSTLTDLEGKTFSETTQGTFLRGLKILDDVGPPLPPRSTHKKLKPASPPDVVAKVKVGREQALLYRLSGDYNALHADPAAARSAGLDSPILHGLCSLGIAARKILRYFCGGHPSALVSVSCRFSKPVKPGDDIEVKMWGRVSSSDSSISSSSNHEEPARVTEAAGVPGTKNGLGTLGGGIKGEVVGGGCARAAKTPERAKQAGNAERQVVARFEKRCSLEQGAAVGTENVSGTLRGGVVGQQTEQQEQVARFEVSSSGHGRGAVRTENVLETLGGRVAGGGSHALVAEQAEQQQEQVVVRFEVCSSGQGGAVVVADGKAVVRRPRVEKEPVRPPPRTWCSKL